MKQKLSYLSFITLTFFLFGFSSVAQDERCATMDALAERLENDARYAQYYEWAHSIPEEERIGQIPCDGTNSIVIPVAFHFAPGVVTCGDSDCLLAEVQDQLDAMNIAYGDNTAASAGMVAACPAAYQDAAGNSVVSTGTCISFCLAIPPEGNAQGLDPACDPPITVGEFTGGFGAGGNGAPGWNGILNLFITNGGCLGVADGIPGAGNGDGVSTCAQAFGGTDPSSGCGLDTEATYGLGATMIHEIGHYLGLYHTFQGGCGDEPNGPGPFNVDDTPPASAPYYGCNMATCQASGCGGGVQAIANFMDYTDDACMTMFTEDQAQVQNYWANQLFGNSDNQCSDPNPTELTSACENSSCVLVCASVVNTPVALTDDFCGTGAGAFPVDPTAVGLVLDDDSDAVYSWSTGGYLSAGGTVIAAPTTLTSVNCVVETETYYLNIDCGTTPLATTLDGGTYVVTVYPAPPADIATLVTISGENGCGEPVVAPIAGCEAYVTVVGDAANPAFPVGAGVSGTASYTVTFTSNAAGPECCIIGNPDDEGEIIVNGDFTAGIPPWTETEESPPGTATTFGVIGISGGFVNGAGDNDAWFGGWGANGSYITISQDITIPACNAVNLTFNYGSINCSGPTNTVVNVIIGGVTVGTIDCNNDAPPATFGPIDIIALGIAPGATTIVFEGIEMPDAAAGSVLIDDVSLVASNCTSPADCDVVVMANFDCMDTSCTDCNDTNCTTTQACDDGDACTINDMETILNDDGSVCVACAGTVDPTSCDAACTTTQACDDVDPCTTNDMETVAADGSVCVACAGTVDPTSCDAACTTTQACDDGDPCTTGEEESVSADGTVCEPCGLNAMAVTPACGDPNATNYDAAATCIDNTLCTYGTYCDNPCYAEYAPNPNPGDIPDPDLCVTALDCADLATIDPACISTQACDDGDPCTENEEVTVILADGSTCADCGLNATAVAAACGDPTATNYDMNATCIDNTLCTYDVVEYCDNPCYAEYNPNPAMGDEPNAALCVTALGCADLAGIDPACISIDACDDGDPCTENEQATTILATGDVCTDCGLNATPVTAACGDPTATNYDATATCIDNTLCVYPCEDAITGSVFTDDPMCPPPGSDFGGISVTIIDVATGMPVAGSPVLTDAMGNYTLAGPFPCGQYTAELDAATLPTCYASLEGETGPLPFSVNGDGTADGADFSNIVMIPTLSQWGLISLALLLMIFGAVKIGSTSINYKRVRK